MNSAKWVKCFPFFPYKTDQDKLFFLKSYACDSNYLAEGACGLRVSIDFYFSLSLQGVWTVTLACLRT